MKRLDQLTQLTAAQLSQDDIIGIRDQSAGQTKYITVKDLTGSPDFGWSSTGESWTFSSWSATTRIGVITVPTDATTKYTPGMRIRIAQTTGGTKYGIIHAVTSTTLSVFFPLGTTLNNEAITSPVYSSLSSPLGFDKDASLWILETLIPNPGATQSSPTVSVWYNLGSYNLVIGIGKWLLGYDVNMQGVGAGVNIAVYVTLHTSNTIPADHQYSGLGYCAGTPGGIYYSIYKQRPYTATSQETHRLYAKSGATALSAITVSSNQDAAGRLFALSAYL